MKPTDLHRDILSSLKHHLHRTGWEQYANTEKLQLFKLTVGADQPLAIALPANGSFIDSRERIQDVLSALSQIEDRPVAEILSEMRISYEICMPI